MLKLLNYIMTLKQYERKRRWRNLSYYNSMCPERRRNPINTPGKQDFNPGSSNYEAEMLTTRQRRK